MAETARALEEVAAAMRKIRSADHAAAVLTQLVDAVPVFCRRAVLLLRSGDRMIGFHSAGPPARPALGGREQLSFEISSAPSIRRAVETKLKVDAKGAQRDISHRLSTEMAYADDEDVRVVPVVLRNTVIGVLLVDGEPIQDSAIETLVLASEAWIEALGSRSDSKQGGEANLA